MDDIKAAEILKSLAAGMDPAAGQPLTSIAPLQSPDVVRALFLAADSLEMRLRQSRRQSTLPRNAGKPWSSDEDERLLAGFDAGWPRGIILAVCGLATLFWLLLAVPWLATGPV